MVLKRLHRGHRIDVFGLRLLLGYLRGESDIELGERYGKTRASVRSKYTRDLKKLKEVVDRDGLLSYESWEACLIWQRESLSRVVNGLLMRELGRRGGMEENRKMRERYRAKKERSSGLGPK